MQTFLPFVNFEASARCLDNRRLGKQRVESQQILNTLEGRSRGWRHHPAVLMWRGYEGALMQYRNAMIVEWIRRGFKNTMAQDDPTEVVLPPWLGRCELHASHRSNLLRKDSEHYGQFGWAESSDLPYWWPTKMGLDKH